MLLQREALKSKKLGAGGRIPGDFLFKYCVEYKKYKMNEYFT